MWCRCRMQRGFERLLHLEHATNFQQKFRRSFRVDIMLPDNARLQLRKRPDLSIRTLQNDKAHANIAAVCALWIIHIQDIFCWIEVLFGSHKPWILSVVQWNWANLVTLADVVLHSWLTAKLTAEWWDFQVSAPSMLILQFLTETLQVRTGVNTLVNTNQDKKSPGTHLGLTLWLSSALRVPICSFPASKRDDSPLRTMANWSGCLTLNVSDSKYNSLPFVWRNHPKPHFMPQ